MFRTFLPMLFGGTRQVPPPPLVPSVIPVPEGVKLHLTAPSIAVDGAGVLYAKTRGPSTRGEIVWTVTDGVATIVLEPGPSEAYGNGSLQVIGGGGFLVTADASNAIRVFPLPGWVKL